MGVREGWTRQTNCISTWGRPAGRGETAWRLRASSAQETSGPMLSPVPGKSTTTTRVVSQAFNHISSTETLLTLYLVGTQGQWLTDWHINRLITCPCAEEGIRQMSSCPCAMLNSMQVNIDTFLSTGKQLQGTQAIAKLAREARPRRGRYVVVVIGVFSAASSACTGFFRVVELHCWAYWQNWTRWNTFNTSPCSSSFLEKCRAVAAAPCWLANCRQQSRLVLAWIVLT